MQNTFELTGLSRTSLSDSVVLAVHCWDYFQCIYVIHQSCVSRGNLSSWQMKHFYVAGVGGVQKEEEDHESMLYVLVVGA